MQISELRDLGRAIDYDGLTLRQWAVVEWEVGCLDLTEVDDFAEALTCYQHPLLSELWNTLLCPATLLIRQILCERHLLWPNIYKCIGSVDVSTLR